MSRVTHFEIHAANPPELIKFYSALSLGATIALAKLPIAGVGWLAYIKDPDGNILGLLQPDPGAK